jgi:hypothetical protein
MEDEVTRGTLIKHLEAPIRLMNAMCNGNPLFFFGKRDATVGDYIDLPDETLMRIHNFGRKSLRDWKRMTAHLGKDYNPDLILSRDVSKNISDELRALRKLRATINHIGGAHKNLARLYGELAEIVLPLDRM